MSGARSGASAEREERCLVVLYERRNLLAPVPEQSHHISSGAVAEADPDDLRREATNDAQPVKVLVLGDEDESATRSVLPDPRISSSFQRLVAKVG